MAYNYRVKYEETKKTLEPICALFDVDNSEITMKFVAAALGAVVLVFMFIYGNPGGGTVQGILLFLIKFLAAWAALAVAAIIINKTVWRKAVLATAAGDAEELSKYRREKDGKNITSQIDFYEDRFESVTKIKTRAFEYGRVIKLLESEQAFGIVIKTDKNIRAVIGFPKDALLEADIEEFKSFLLGRCPQVKNKIKKL
ncbi:MAG: YcxB family protein [Dorea sp.]|nr:YcxB family protein [Dorea sp.]